MSNYGVMIGGGPISADLSKISIYNFFVHYFDNPTMKKFKEVNGIVFFGCRIPTHLAVNSKYIIATVEAATAPRGESVTLDQIDWTSLQTRILDEKHNVPVHKYIEKTNQYTTADINVFEKSDSMYKYKCSKMPGLTIALLFTKAQTRIYADVGTVKMAIETYNTVVTV